jgi:hypothetical protein
MRQGGPQQQQEHQQTALHPPREVVPMAMTLTLVVLRVRGTLEWVTSSRLEVSASRGWCRQEALIFPVSRTVRSSTALAVPLPSKTTHPSPAGEWAQARGTAQAAAGAARTVIVMAGWACSQVIMTQRRERRCVPPGAPPPAVGEVRPARETAALVIGVSVGLEPELELEQGQGQGQGLKLVQELELVWTRAARVAAEVM